MLKRLAAFALTLTSLTASAFCREYPLDAQGFIHHWVFTGAKTTPVTDESQKADAVFKAFQGEEVPFPAPGRFDEIGKTLPNGMALLPAGQRDKLFLDDYKFHRTLCRLEGYAVTALVTPVPVTVKVRWWTGWGQIQAWIGGKPVHTAAHFKSQPASAPGQIRLEAGTNLVFIRRIGMGQRNQVFETGLQIQGAPANLTVAVPGDPGQVSSYFEAEAWIADLKSPSVAQITSDQRAPSGVSVYWDRKTIPWPPGQSRFLWPLADGEEAPQSLRIDLVLPGTTLSRTIDWPSRSPIVYPPALPLEAHRARLMDQMTKERTLFWGLFRGFQWMSRLRAGADAGSAEMKALIGQMTTAIANRDGTSDFQLAAALRLLYHDGAKLPEDQRSSVKACLLDFRYWEDEKGTDTLSFSSENHQILLHSSQLLAGLLYPDDTFTRSGRTGSAQAEVALKRLDDWLALREKEGLEEFLAPAYHGETAVALLNLYDFVPREGNIPSRAKTVLDHLFRLSARHSLGGLALGANGRCYRRELLPPQTQPRQAFLSWALPEAAFAVVPQLMALYTSKYAMPEDLADLSRRPGEETFREGGTVLYLKKQKDYLLSSTTLPVPEEVSGPWSKAFVPGSFCYQSHLWELSLGGHARIFVNHPGSTSELLDARPGYWVGEGTAPMLKAEGGEVFEIYRLSPEHPVSFTHAWFPTNAFDESQIQGNWAFARKGDGYGALWCSEVLVPYDQAAVGCELRAGGRVMAWYARGGSKDEDGSFPSFMEKIRALRPAFDEEGGALTVGGKSRLIWPK